jgi:ABC-2 type transport system permease protein
VDSPTATEVATSIARSFTADLNGAVVAAVAAGAGGPTGSGDPTTAAAPEAVAAAARRAMAVTPPVRLADVSTRTKILDTATYLSAGMAVFFLFFTVQFGVASLVEERAGGTLHRLLALPIRPSSILLAKLLTSLLLGVISMTVLLVATTLLLGASFGAPAGVAVLVVAAVLAATGITAVIASLARTAEQAGGWQSIISTVLGLLGGTFFPIAQVSGFSSIVLLTPHAWFLRGLAELADGGGVTDALPAAGAMLAFATVCGGIGFARLRRVVSP